MEAGEPWIGIIRARLAGVLHCLQQSCVRTLAAERNKGIDRLLGDHAAPLQSAKNRRSLGRKCRTCAACEAICCWRKPSTKVRALEAAEGLVAIECPLHWE